MHVATIYFCIASVNLTAEGGMRNDAGICEDPRSMRLVLLETLAYLATRDSNSPLKALSNELWVGIRLRGEGLHKVDLGDALRRRMPLECGSFYHHNSSCHTKRNTSTLGIGSWMVTHLESFDPSSPISRSKHRFVTIG